MQIVLVLIEQYLDLKAGEVWAELVEELDAEGVVPVDVSPASWLRVRASHASLL
jgi:hypothetical protein